MKNGEKNGTPPIVVVDYDPRWATLFSEFRDTLWPHVEDIATAFEHVGSTSVPGLVAKPIIDMDIVVPNMTVALEVIERLTPLGYTHRGELGVRGRHAFFHPEDAPKHHLYVCLEGSIGLRNHLALRDYLRAHPAAVSEYTALKMRLAEQHSNDIDAYIEGKTAFIVGILEQLGLARDDLFEVVGANKAPDSST